MEAVDLKYDNDFREERKEITETWSKKPLETWRSDHHRREDLGGLIVSHNDSTAITLCKVILGETGMSEGAMPWFCDNCEAIQSA